MDQCLTDIGREGGGTQITTRTGSDLSWRKHFENRRQSGERTSSTRGATYVDSDSRFHADPAPCRDNTIVRRKPLSCSRGFSASEIESATQPTKS